MFELQVHLVWTTKYRKPILTGEVAVRTRELIRQACRELEVEILKGYVSKDHVHLLVSLPPSVAVSKLMQQMKGKASFKLLLEFKHLQRAFWGRHVWARGYFACSTGQVTDEAVRAYIENQVVELDEDFRVEGEG